MIDAVPQKTVPYACACGKTVQCKSARLPRGWKCLHGVNHCPDCWGKKYSLKAIAIPVLRPLGEGVGWEQFRKSLGEAWADSTSLANWLMTEYFTRDHRRGRDDQKIPKMPDVYLYPEAVKRFPDMATQAVAGMCQAIGQKYRSKRFDVMWTAAASLPNMRYPYPAAYPAQAWKPSYETAGKDGGDLIPCVSVAMRRGERYTLQLRGGTEFRRQLRDFKNLVAGQGVQSELVLYRQRVGEDHCNGVTARDSGGQKAQYRVMCKMVGWFQKPEHHGERTGTLAVSSQPDAMLAALDEKGERIWWVNGDHVRRWQAEHKSRLQRLAEDQKHETRLPSQKTPAPMQSLRERISQKNRNRLKSWINETAAQLVGLAVRRHYAVIKYDDQCRTYLQSFPWAALKDRIATKCAEHNLEFVEVKPASDKVAVTCVDIARDHETI